MKKTKPRASKPLSSTVRELGRPSASAVESTIALGSTTPASSASWNHWVNWPIGSAARSPSTRPSCV